MTVLDLSLYVVTGTAQCGGRGVPATVAAAVAGGATMVQLRDHDLDDEDFVALGRQVRQVLSGTGVPLLVNDRVHLVERIGADGAHVGQHDMPPVQVRELLGPEAIIGWSAAAAELLDAARRGPDDHATGGERALDYLGVGPVWASTTKSGHREPIGPGGIARVAAASPWPVVAIGGITAERVPELHDTGAAGIAVVSAVCAVHDQRAAAEHLRAVWEGAHP